ncbi:tRNA (guanine-N(7)-)-methyltransferase [Rubidibacter lacunae KORDI 51-2]|uniref:tRNA (guanine-N(7)-)-methyltransferase n=1 Tax=Rubidibacter lacunae KORDI 51-2 TaxID=582515 RepID=U5DP23_9CHRO|nr:tRNA (guanosine(46)-N7)-methyltransferase TrmB [Rubidibacter lacunae]ERN41460.1 tRNA (guanine-N(7)-)-methyltransferase [Rubidibacter lacunae KORDI 51-2]
MIYSRDKKLRVRQHVNPLAQKYQTSFEPPDWSAIYPASHQPLFLDIGSARGWFLLEMAQRSPDWNYLGLEIRQPLVDEANRRKTNLESSNLHYLFCNANIALPALLASLPPGALNYVAIQFPDPWFKNRHAKRRVVQPDLVTSLAMYMSDGGTVFLQSDVRCVAEEMRDRFAASPHFQPTSASWLPENPLEIVTERERSCQDRCLPIYRLLLRKCRIGVPGSA